LQAEKANLQHLLSQEGMNVSETQEELSQCQQQHAQAQHVIVTLQAEKASLQQLLSQEAINVYQTQEELSQCQQQPKLSCLQKMSKVHIIFYINMQKCN
jgi:DNA-binding transcriptional MerR regulator